MKSAKNNLWSGQKMQETNSFKFSKL